MALHSQGADEITIVLLSMLAAGAAALIGQIKNQTEQRRSARNLAEQLTTLMELQFALMAQLRSDLEQMLKCIFDPARRGGQRGSHDSTPRDILPPRDRSVDVLQTVTGGAQFAESGALLNRGFGRGAPFIASTGGRGVAWPISEAREQRPPRMTVPRTRTGRAGPSIQTRRAPAFKGRGTPRFGCRGCVRSKA
jgi:hypothetical protein